MLLEVLMQYSCINSHKLSSLERRFRDIQIVIITNFVVVSSVGIKRVDCFHVLPSKDDLSCRPYNVGAATSKNIHSDMCTKPRFRSNLHWAHFG